jgi:dsDNA-binding SOS-regulon protein
MWKEISNPKAGNEIEAHCSMFKKEKNDGYDAMLDAAKELICQWLSNEPKAVVDDYKPSREVLHRTMSETKLWDDDGKVLNSEGQSKKEGNEDEEQLQAILKCDDMPLPEGGDEASFLEALEVPLPVDEDLVAATRVLSLKDAIKAPLPEDDGVDFGKREEINKEKQENSKDQIEKSSGWSFKSPLSMIYGSQKGVKQEETESQKENPKSAGWSVKTPFSMLYGSQKEIQMEVENLKSN